MSVGCTTGECEVLRSVVSDRDSLRAFSGVSALLFATSVAVTIASCVSMASMGGMRMPGGWTMSMAWMRMPGQTWPGAAASFLGMWVVMMIAMMLPSLMPMLWRYRRAVAGASETRLAWLTALVTAGYFFVWAAFGLAAFPLGAGLAAVEMQWPALAGAVPIAVGGVVLIAGVLQFTAWKAHQLACCRQVPWRGRALPANAGSAWRQGLRLGLLHLVSGDVPLLLHPLSRRDSKWPPSRHVRVNLPLPAGGRREETEGQAPLLLRSACLVCR